MIENHQNIILNQGEHILKMNYIYEGLIYIGKDSYKLQGLNKIIGGKYLFEKYELDLKLNQRIEEIMKKYKEEYR